MKRRTESKSEGKKTRPSSRSKSIGRMTTQKKPLLSGRKSLTQSAKKGLDRHSKNDSIFSYKSADDKNVLAIIDAVRTGISFNEFEKIVGNAPFSLAEWANYLQLSERTIQRNQKEKKSFQPIQSERIIELIMLYEYGVDVFGDKDNFNVWLKSKSVALGGRTPKELLDTKFGVGMIKDELGRIEHGVLA
ncbi:MAG: type II RES/Xre toxin-antitoxin system antitoxin [Chitinophagaceae bacterium]